MKNFIFADGEEFKYIKYSKKQKSYLPSKNIPKQNKTENYNSVNFGDKIIDLGQDIINNHLNKSTDNLNKSFVPRKTKVNLKLSNKMVNKKITRNSKDKLNYTLLEFKENKANKDLSLRIKYSDYCNSVASLDKIKRSKEASRNNTEINFNSNNLMTMEEIETLLKKVKEKIELKLNIKKYSLKEIEISYYFDLILAKIYKKIMRNLDNKYLTHEFVDQIINSEIEKLFYGSAVDLTLPKSQLPKKIPSIGKEMSSQNISKEYINVSNSNFKNRNETIGEESDYSSENSFSKTNYKMKGIINNKKLTTNNRNLYQSKSKLIEDDFNISNINQMGKSIENTNLQYRSKADLNNSKNETQYSINSTINNRINPVTNKGRKPNHKNNHNQDNKTTNEKFYKESNSKVTPTQHISIIQTFQIDHLGQQSETSKIKKGYVKDKIDKIKMNDNSLVNFYNPINSLEIFIKEDEEDKTKEGDSIVESDLKHITTNSSQNFVYTDHEDKSELKNTVTSLLNKFKISSDNLTSSKIDHKENKKHIKNGQLYRKQFTVLDKKNYSKHHSFGQIRHFPTTNVKNTEIENNRSVISKNISNNTTKLTKESHEENIGEVSEMQVKNILNDNYYKYSIQKHITNNSLSENNQFLDDGTNNEKSVNIENTILQYNDKPNFILNKQKTKKRLKLKHNTVIEPTPTNYNSRLFKSNDSIVKNTESNEPQKYSKPDTSIIVKRRSSRHILTMPNLNLKRTGTESSKKKESIKIDNQPKVNENVETVSGTKSNVSKFVISSDSFSTNKITDNNLLEEYNQKSKKYYNKTRAKIVLFDDMEEIEKETSEEEINSNNISMSEDILTLEKRVSRANIDLKGLIKYKNIAEKLKNKIQKTPKHAEYKDKHSRIFELLELIKQQEKLTMQKMEEKKSYISKYFDIKHYSNHTNQSLSNFSKNRIKSLSELQEELSLRKKNMVLRNKVDHIITKEENFNDELKNKRDQVYNSDVNQDMNLFLRKIQSGINTKKLDEQLCSLQNYDAENFVKNITEIYKNLKYEELEILNVSKNEQRLNTFMDLLEDSRKKNKNIKNLHQSKLKCIDGKFESTTGPILYKIEH